jgi:hypothetical protein
VWRRRRERESRRGSNDRHGGLAGESKKLARSVGVGKEVPHTFFNFYRYANLDVVPSSSCSNCRLYMQLGGGRKNSQHTRRGCGCQRLHICHSDHICTITKTDRRGKREADGTLICNGVCSIKRSAQRQKTCGIERKPGGNTHHIINVTTVRRSGRQPWRRGRRTTRGCVSPSRMCITEDSPRPATRIGGASP